jgi:chromosome segregation protein
MRLKRLILQGYKTFASKTEFRFDEGITSIIGPNGSGKSNVADAVRWVLGEQSYSTLRGKRTVDMIFTGSRNRSRAGMAQVMLTLDNDDGWLPIDFAEVEIGRRAFRSGENEYILNGQKVRLRDITELLATSGLAERTYTIIGQGLVDQALSLRAEERRALFEEAAGVSHYKSKRAQALRRLEETQRNLERIHDILAEIRPRLRSLRRQATRARNYEQIAADLRQQLRLWYGYQWEQQKEALRATRESASSIEAVWKKGRLTLSSELTKQDEQKRRYQLLQEEMAETRTLRENCLGQLESARRQKAVLDERKRSIARQLGDIEVELPALEQQQTAADMELAESLAALEAAQSALAESQSHLARFDSTSALASAQVEVDAVGSAQTGNRAAVRGIELELTELRNSLRQSEGRLNQRRNAFARHQARADLLAEMGFNETGVSRDARHLGPLNQAVSLPAEFAFAIETALQNRLATLIIEDAAELWHLFDLAERSKPLAAVALDSIQPPDELDLPDDPMVIDWIANLVRCESRFLPVVKLLFGRTLLVDGGVRSALNIARSLPVGAAAVTRAGIIAHAGGLVERPGGDIGNDRSSMVKAREKAVAEAEALEGELSSLETAVAKQRHHIDEKQKQLEDLLTKGDRLRQREEESSRRLRQIQSQQQSLRQDAASAQTIVAGRQAVVDSRRATLNQVAIQVDRLSKRRESMKQETPHQSLDEVKATVDRLEQELEKIDERFHELSPRLSKQRQLLSHIEKNVSAIRIQNHQQEGHYTQAKIALSQQETRIEALQERIKAELGIVALIYDDEQTGPTPLPMRDVVEKLPQVDEIPDDVEQTIQQYRGQLQRMGAINPEAPSEYEETQERFDFLTQQVEDLDRTGEQLNNVIRELDDLTSRAFVETVERVNTVFGTTFTELFGGGSARLTLIDPEDLTNSGVDIIARLPNRREQGLALLSGGERSLTAVALIFSLLKVAPTPFCVLDEVDAALDEANINRFRELLGELSAKTQFIVITHNRGTVQAAQTLYGISMGIDGTSQAISIRPEEYVKQEMLV